MAIQRGDVGALVRSWQEFLVAQKLLQVRSVTGGFDAVTQAATIKYQQRKGLTRDGVVGSGSLRAEGLESPANVRTGSGSVRLVYEKVPADGELAIRAGALDHGERSEELRRLSAQRVRPPGSDTTRCYSIATLERWLYAFKKGGLEALVPQGRGDRGRGRNLDPELRELLCDIRREHPSVSVTLVLRTLRADGRIGDEVTECTVRRMLAERGLARTVEVEAEGGKARLRWEAERPGRSATRQRSTSQQSFPVRPDWMPFVGAIPLPISGPAPSMTNSPPNHTSYPVWAMRGIWRTGRKNNCLFPEAAKKGRAAHLLRGLRLCFMNVILVGMASFWIFPHCAISFPEATGLPSAVSR